MSRSHQASFSWIVGVMVCALLLAALPAAAGDSRWYLVGKVGQASVEEQVGPPILGWQVDGEDTAATFEVGYTVHRYLSIQAGYHDLGTYAGQPRPCPEGSSCPLNFVVPVFPLEADFTGFSLSAVPRWPLTERVSVYGKVGVFDWQGDTKPLFPGQSLEDPSGTDLLTGLGAAYSLPKGFGVLLEFEHTELMDALSLGASWRF